jgi:serine/threonine-protein kinase PpkA
MTMEVDGYQVKRELGKGGMATVYLAVQESFDRDVALKVMAPELVADSTFGERFLREARIVAHLAHPHIVSVYDVGVSNGNYFLAMELHTGGDLASKIAGGITHPKAIDILRQIGGALDYAHSNGYVHRDIKPGNVLFSHHGHVVLTDFGIAKAADSSTDLTQVKRVVGEREMTQEGSIVGTPSYMSPEQARGQAVDGRADMYGLGIMLFEMLTRTVPYQSTDPFAVAIMHINEPIPKLPKEHGLFQPLLEKLLAKQPDDRYQNGAELIEALDELARKIGTPKASPEELRTMIVQPGEIPAAARREGNRRLGLFGVAGGLLVVSAIGAYVVLSSAPSSEEGAEGGSETGAIAVVEESIDHSNDPATGNAAASESSRDERIARLLAEAQEAIKLNHLSSPPGDNALERYRQVFELDPSNKAAREGQVQVADRYLDLAKTAVGERRVRSARRYVDKVAEFAPAHPELASAQQLVANAEKSATAAPKNELRIMGLLGQARIALNDDKLTTPKGQSAYDKYKAVLVLDPNHARALDGIQRVGTRYLQLANSAIEQGELEKADEYLARAEMVSPGHPDLSSARTNARAARN